MAYFNTLTMSFGFAGSLVSGLIAKLAISQGWRLGWFGPYLMVFALSALLRALIVLFFARPIKEVRDIEPSPGLPYFYVYKPFQDFTGALFRARQKMRSAGKKRK
jgi:hypothetical protein